MTRRELSKEEKKSWKERRELRRKELEEEAKLMTLSQYGRLKQEKKGRRNNKTEGEKKEELEKARMMEMQKKFEGMELVQKKNELDKDVRRSVEGTLKGNKSFGKNVKANKSVLSTFSIQDKRKTVMLQLFVKKMTSTLSPIIMPLLQNRVASLLLKYNMKQPSLHLGSNAKCLY